ncbi:hypothetical protein M404DRAFT_21189 [Pisolithus tinctorius Marx 270]|uniref:Zn(2)-C6 fungal-type domain-containing protein n=1 Tax=Pisolithus tinctorius Marx 270 TaxID=870435 RepID=A0A0C3PQZ3_PISTI|nr:hypothetical protein M404DRAFT_21189 [Pisolithus tinctorius Marx 270]
MSNSRLIVAADNNDKGWVIIDWTQMPDDNIRYDTDNEEEVMKVKAKERKRQKAAEQARREEQAQLEAERAEREKAEAERAAQEVEERRAREEEERWEAECRRKAEASKGDETGGEVKKVVMDPSCTRCARAHIVCEFVVDGNKKRVACVRCNQSKGKCRWPGDGKDAEAGPKAVKGKKRKVDEENAKARPSSQKRAKTSTRPTEILDLNESEAGRSRPREAGADKYLGLEGKLDLFELHETAVENLGCIANALESILDESYSFGMAVSPLDSCSSELDSEELREEAEWLRTHGEDKEEETEGEDEAMAEGK